MVSVVPHLPSFSISGSSAAPSNIPEANRKGSCAAGPLFVLACAISGGNWNNGSKAGVSYFNSNNDLANSKANIGARLACTFFGNAESKSIIALAALPYGRTSSYDITGLVVSFSEASARSEVCRSFSMRRISEVYKDIVSMEFLIDSAEIACDSCSDKAEVSAFMKDFDDNVACIQRMLVEHSYVPSQYRFFHKNEHGKDRFISFLPLYPDRVIHVALTRAVQDRMDAKLIPHCYGSVKGRGPHQMIRDLYDDIQDDPRLKDGYIFIFDIVKCFPSIPKDLLKLRLRHVVKDKEALWLFDTIIDGYPLPGISIGDILSPLLANMFLSPLDHMLVERYRCHYLGRFMDDGYVMGYSKPWLHRIEKAVGEWLNENGLQLKDCSRIVPIRCGFTLVGYTVYPDHILLKTATKKRLQRRCRSFMRRLDAGIPLSDHDRHVLSSYNGCLCHCNGRNLYSKTIGAVLEKDAELQEKMMSEIVVSRAFRFIFCEVSSC